MSEEVISDSQQQATPETAAAVEQKLQETFYGANSEAKAEAPVNGDTQKTEPSKEASKEAKPEEKPAEQTKTEDKEAKPLELKLPENALLTAEHLKELEAYAREKNLTQEQAQAMLEREAKSVADYVQAQEATLEGLRTEWFEQCKSDKEVGGDKFSASAESAKRVVDKFATPEFKEILKQTGYGNHPELLRVFARIGNAMADDKMVLSKAQIGKTKPLENVFYGDS